MTQAAGKRRWLGLLAVAVLACVAGAWFGWQRHEPKPAQADAVASLRAASLPDVEGRPVALSSYNDRLVVVNFWATWCPPCVEEMPELSDLQRQLDGAPGRVPVQILGIGVDSAAKIAEFARKHQIAYPLLVAGAGGLDMLRAFGNDSGGLPFTVVIDENGRIIEQISGRVDIKQLRARLDAVRQPG